MSLDGRARVHAVPPRIAVATGSLLLVLALGSAGCHVGPTDPGLGGEPGPDGSAASGGGDGSGGGNANCTEIEPNVTDTGTHPVGYEYQTDGGQGCVNPTCHTNNQGTSFTVSGSVYTRRESAGEPVAGAH